MVRKWWRWPFGQEKLAAYLAVDQGLVVATVADEPWQMVAGGQGQVVAMVAGGQGQVSPPV